MSHKIISFFSSNKFFLAYIAPKLDVSTDINVPDKRDRGQPACPKVWKKYEERNE
jgi:hypothetical protein